MWHILICNWKSYSKITDEPTHHNPFLINVIFIESKNIINSERSRLLIVAFPKLHKYLDNSLKSYVVPQVRLWLYRRWCAAISMTIFLKESCIQNFQMNHANSSRLQNWFLELLYVHLRPQPIKNQLWRSLKILTIRRFKRLWTQNSLLALRFCRSNPPPSYK